MPFRRVLLKDRTNAANIILVFLLQRNLTLSMVLFLAAFLGSSGYVAAVFRANFQ